MQRAWLLTLLACLCCARIARADSYEWQRMQRVLADLGLEPAAVVDGKRIAWIRIASDDVFVKDEVWPLWLNWFHATTREHVVRRELLFQEGEPFDNARIEETMRNLRGMGLFALVRIVAVKIDDPNAVGIVVHTRDLWSLRLETGFNASTLVDQFTARLIERNFLGRNQALGASFNLLPRTFAVAEEYAARRVLGSTVRVEQSAGVIFNRERREAEGSSWLLRVSEPYYYLRQRWAWSSVFSYSTQAIRRLQQKRIIAFPPESEDADGPYAQRAWRQQDATAAAAGYFRLGEAVKNTFGLGWDFRYRDSRRNRETMLVPELEEYFETRVIPRQRRESGPTLSYDLFTPRYVTFENLTTFGQSENVRVGPTFTLLTRVPLEAFGSNTNSWVVDAQAGFSAAPGGFLLDAKVQGVGRLERERWVDQRFNAVARGASPVLFKAFRVVARVGLELRRNDTVNTYVTLGSSNGLRGYKSQELLTIGGNRLLANFELRSVPFLAWEAVHIGGVVFYDVGSVYNERASFALHHAVGLGLRVLFPQLNRTPFSFDGASPLDPPFRFVPTIKDGQVVPLTPTEDEPD
jgi:hypothetical protein